MLRQFAARFRRWFLGEHIYSIGRYWMGMDDLALRLNAKAMGYRLARELAPRLRAVSAEGEPRERNLGWRASTQRDIESPWFAHWCAELRIAPIYHRKLWEYAYVLQNLHDAGLLREGVSGLGFGCGEEPMASYLARRGARVTVTDLDPARAKGLGWMETGQHTTAVEQAFRPELVSREVFERLVSLEYVDMNEIPSRLDRRYDFCWSICAFEHLGSIERGLRFVERSMDTLREGGLAIHTSELSYFDGSPDVESGPTVLFRPRHYQELASRLSKAGHEVATIDFDVGGEPLDQFIDVPPYSGDSVAAQRLGRVREDVGYLKLSVSGAPATCFGIAVRKRPERA